MTKKVSMKLSVILVIGIIAGFILTAGCGGGGGGTGGGTTTGQFTGAVNTTTGAPVGGATVSLTKAVGAGMSSIERNSTITGADGTFSISQLEADTYNVTITKTGHKTLIFTITINTTNPTPDVTLPLPDGEGTVTITLPTQITLNNPDISYDSVSLQWTESTAGSFTAYLINRSTSSTVNSKSQNVGVIDAQSITHALDTLVPAGTWYYRVYQAIPLAEGGTLLYGSNVVSAQVSESAALPSYFASVILATWQDAMSSSTNHTIAFSLAPTLYTGTIPATWEVFTNSPIPFGGEQMFYEQGQYNTITHYYYGNPVNYIGQITAYFDSRIDLNSYFNLFDVVDMNDIIGIKGVRIDTDEAQIVDYNNPMPDNYIMHAMINHDNTLTWDMVDDGAHTYDWRYIVIVRDSHTQKVWSNIDMRDYGFRSISIFRNRLALVGAVNSSVSIPDGIFEPGSYLDITIIASPVNMGSVSYSSELQNTGTGDAYMVIYDDTLIYP